jgi:hypothetical protein
MKTKKTRERQIIQGYQVQQQEYKNKKYSGTTRKATDITKKHQGKQQEQAQR